MENDAQRDAADRFTVGVGPLSAAADHERYAWIPESAKKQPCPSSRRFSGSSSECISEIIILHIFMSSLRARRRRLLLTVGFGPEIFPPAPPRKLVRDWARRHRLELMINWRNIEKGRPLNRIKPLE